MDTQSKSKKRTLEKKKISKSKINKSEVKVEGISGTSICNMVQNEGKVVVYEPNEEKVVGYKQDDEAQSLPNGLIIEELAKRDPKGKLTLRGRKVHSCQHNISYISFLYFCLLMLKDFVCNYICLDFRLEFISLRC